MSAQTEIFSETPPVTPDYNLDQNTLARLSTGLLASRHPRGNERFACYLLSGDEEASNIGRTVEYRQFNQSFHNTQEQMTEEYGPYELDSDFFVVIDREEVEPAGVLRVIDNGANGLKTLNDIAEKPLEINTRDFQDYHGVIDLDTCRDIGTAAVLRKYRSAENHIVSSMLYRAMDVSAVSRGIEHYVSVIDRAALNNFRLLGMPFESINGSQPFSYLGSKQSTAVYGRAAEFTGSVRENYQNAKNTQPLKARMLAPHVARLTRGKDIDTSFMFEH